jgi:superoxide dismutase
VHAVTPANKSSHQGHHANHMQEYVESLEATAAEQRKQLGRLKEEKRAQEKVRHNRQLQLRRLRVAL